MNRYDSSQAPDPVEWLYQDEQARVVLVEKCHRRARVDVPNLTLRATMHVVVENQLASRDEPVVRALARLIKEGFTRHDAVYAIGSVVAGQIYDVLKLGDTPEASRARYYAVIECLSAAEWRDGYL